MDSANRTSLLLSYLAFGVSLFAKELLRVFPAMTRKKSGPNLGNSLSNDRRRRAEKLGAAARGVAEGQAQRSVLEQSSLDDFIAKAERPGQHANI